MFSGVCGICVLRGGSQGNLVLFQLLTMGAAGGGGGVGTGAGSPGIVSALGRTRKTERCSEPHVGLGS